MLENFTLTTERENVILRQLTTFQDDLAYWQAIEANRDHLSQFGDDTAEKYQSIRDVVLARIGTVGGIRMGIWDSDTFVGFIKAVPNGDEAEIGYWVDGRHTGHGYASVATKSLAGHLASKYRRIHAEVAIGNEASVHSLMNAGFEQTAIDENQMTFELPKAT